ncbi:flagellar assembly peptidoglycan hydrolase FlgJ [Stenotrophomonas sp. 278]|uniref:flagellar assembly peptidoglycan hydrolase FlgJ n=1 Tax=Stenotrophomonas sp. 278 TaxID=2479851 RepID=UPI000F68694C|nr:flagellar assembly peptidoglycan hydrolase FlgJ [Stenotrophomonas sp. 278]RRU22781.1 flagellar assembly peptidoglycan hydrolase FlgJ [Stenotrophomonas sp. 278]
MRIQPALELNPAQPNSPAKVDKVARQLEGQFAQMLVKSMRDASFGDSLLPGENTMFRDMYDQKIADAMTKGRGLGLSAMIARQLGGGDADAAKPVDTRLDPSAALRAYRLNGPAAAPMSLPTGTAPASTAPTEVDLLQQLNGRDPSAVLQPMERALDLIAGRETSQMHEAIGRSEPYAATDTTGTDWSTMADDRWSGVNAPAAATSAVDTLASSTAAAQLGAHTPEGFVASIWGHAQQAARELGVDAKALVAQAALETGWGRKLIQRNGGAGSSHNLFGIKATGWSGERATTGTHEYVNGVRRNETASFRAYGSVGESFADYVKLLKNSPRYQNALQAGTDVRGFARGLQQAGYATDPSYAAKIAAIAGGPTIERAVAAVDDASQRLGRTFASTTSPAGLGVIRR